MIGSNIPEPGDDWTQEEIDRSFDIVDAVSKEDPQGMTATFFVKIGDE